MNAPAADPELGRALPVYAHLQERARAARGLRELWFTIANETWQLLPYTQAYLWQLDGGPARLRTAAGLAQLAEDSLLTVWLKRFGRWLERHVGDDPVFIVRDDIPAELGEGWDEWMGPMFFVQPVPAPDGRRLGMVGFVIEEAPSEAIQVVLLRTFSAYGHAWAALAPRRRARLRGRARWAGWAAAALLVAALFVPVRLSVLAPAEIVGLDARVISAPMDGVIESFAVEPNQAVKAGQLLFSLDATTLVNRREVALRQLQVARADALAAAQKAFTSDASRADLAALEGKVAEREAEVTYLDELLDRIRVHAPAPGVIVFGDINDWIGKPVATGERVALLADPEQAGVLVWLPVADAINLEEGADVRVFLQVAPLRPIRATLSQTSYQAVTSPEGISAYRLRARFTDDDPEARALARIGLKGTAKIYGRSAPLAYYLFRRPLAALREWTGL